MNNLKVDAVVHIKVDKVMETKVGEVVSTEAVKVVTKMANKDEVDAVTVVVVADRGKNHNGSNNQRRNV